MTQAITWMRDAFSLASPHPAIGEWQHTAARMACTPAAVSANERRLMLVQLAIGEIVGVPGTDLENVASVERIDRYRRF